MLGILMLLLAIGAGSAAGKGGCGIFSQFNYRGYRVVAFEVEAGKFGVVGVPNTPATCPGGKCYPQGWFVSLNQATNAGRQLVDFAWEKGSG